MSVWSVQQAGTFNVASDEAASPWYDGGAQTALASIPQNGDTITNAGAFSLTFTVDLPDAANVLDDDTVWGVVPSMSPRGTPIRGLGMCYTGQRILLRTHRRLVR